MRSVLIMVFASSILLSACGPSGNEPNVELIQDMMLTPALKPQEKDESSPHNRAMRVPPEGTLAVGTKSFKYFDNPVGAGENLKNPYAGGITEEELLIGRTHYETLCVVCHGGSGKGDGTVAPKMAVKPPSLLTEKVRNYPDGRLYHIVRVGQGVMGPYGAQVGRDEHIWAVVSYVRELQKLNQE